MKKRTCMFAVGVGILIGMSIVGCGLDEPNPSYGDEDLLVSASWLDENSSSLTIVDTRSHGRYLEGHIEGAVSAHWTEFVDDSMTLLPNKQLGELLGEKGISSDSPVVVYGNLETDPGADVRMFWMLEYLGHEDVHVLNGGASKWLEDGYSFTDGEVEPGAAEFEVNEQPSLLATIDDLPGSQSEVSTVVWDIRPDEEFYGWPVAGEAVGGHIPGSVQYDYRRLFIDTGEFQDAAGLASVLEFLGIEQETDVITTGNDGSRSAYAYLVLRLMGYSDVKNYDGSMIEWGESGENEVVSLPSYSKLVYAEWVKELMEGGNPETYQGEGFVIVDASTFKEYSSGHIPGAVNIEFTEYNQGGMPPSSPEDANLKPGDELQEAIENQGISANMTVIVYGSIMPNVARVAWTLMYAGVQDVRILNGGLSAWTARGYSTETEEQTPVPTTFGIDVPGNPELLINSQQLAANLGSESQVIVDNRSFDEYTGIDDHEYITNPGHIPGALSQDWVTWIEEDGTFANFDVIADEWKGLGITSDRSLVFT